MTVSTLILSCGPVMNILSFIISVGDCNFRITIHDFEIEIQFPPCAIVRIIMDSESLAVSGLQKMYMREWDNAQEAIDTLPQIPILSDINLLINTMNSTIVALLESDTKLGVFAFKEELEHLTNFMTVLSDLVGKPGFSESVDAAIIVAASQQDGAPGLPVMAGFSLISADDKPTLEIPYNLVDVDGHLMPKHEATARSIVALDKISNELHCSLPRTDESLILWERNEKKGD